MKRIDKIVKYTYTEAIKENTTGKHINATSLIRSSPNTHGLHHLVQPSVVTSLLCLQNRVLQQCELNLSLNTQQIQQQEFD